MNGFVAINKPIGLSSSDVVIKVRNALTKCLSQKQKAGHLGTLDPEAEGVLTIALGSATKLFDFCLNKTKTYIADFTFGLTTDTLDRAGTITHSGDRIPQLDEIQNILSEFVGAIIQIPPQFSAKNVGGKRAYQLARRGESVELQGKNVLIHEFTHLEAVSDNTHRFKICCGAGTYIRSLARDVGTKLNTSAYMSNLIRTVDGKFTLEDCINLEDFLIEPLKHVLTIERMLLDLPKVSLSAENSAKLLNGVRPLFNNLKVDSKEFLVYDSVNKLLGIGEKSNDKLKLKVRLI